MRAGCIRRIAAEIKGELLCAIVRLLDLGRGIESLKRRMIFAEYVHDVLAPHVRTGAQMGKHISGRPAIGFGRDQQLSR